MADEFQILMYGMGKMGRAAYEAISHQEGMRVCTAYDISNSRLAGLDESIRKDMPSAQLIKEISRRGVKNVVVDFSSEEGTRYLFERFSNSEFKPEPPFVVTGTTPLSKKTEKYTDSVAGNKGIVAVRAPNFSLAVNRFLSDMENITPPDPDDFITIYEVHRRDKATTSGTAIVIARTLCQRFNRDGYITSLPSPAVAFSPKGTAKCLIESEIQTRRESPKWIDISAIRHADEPGTHVVKIGNERSYREYKVRATREDYAAGVVEAIRALTSPLIDGPGFYDFKTDILELSRP